MWLLLFYMVRGFMLKKKKKKKKKKRGNPIHNIPLFIPRKSRVFPGKSRENRQFVF